MRKDWLEDEDGRRHGCRLLATSGGSATHPITTGGGNMRTAIRGRIVNPIVAGLIFKSNFILFYKASNFLECFRPRDCVNNMFHCVV